MKRVSACAILLVVTAGCGESHRHAASAFDHRGGPSEHSGRGEHSGQGSGGGGDDVGVEAIAEGVLAVASAIGSLASQSESEGSSDDEDEERPPPFNERRALLAIGEVNLAPCIAQGAPRGRGRARVTFRPDGAVTQVEILAPVGMSASANACIIEALSDATAPRFTGVPTDVGAAFRVR